MSKRESNSGALVLALTKAFLGEMSSKSDDKELYAKTLKMINDAEEAFGNDLITWPVKPLSVIAYTMKEMCAFASEALTLLSVAGLKRIVEDAALEEMMHNEPPAGTA